MQSNYRFGKYMPMSLLCYPFMSCLVPMISHSLTSMVTCASNRTEQASYTWPMYSFYIIHNIKLSIFFLMPLLLTNVVQTFPRGIGAQT